MKQYSLIDNEINCYKFIETEKSIQNVTQKAGYRSLTIYSCAF